METIDLWLVAKWECGNCGEENQDAASCNRGVVITCQNCGREYEVGDVCSD